MFAVAKVGLPNMVIPNTLDMKIMNFENHDSYMQITELYYPEHAKSQISVIVLRPMVVKNGLNDLFVHVLKANEFMVIKRETRILTKAEVAYLFKREEMHGENAQIYYSMMMQGPSELITVSKVGAVLDAHTIFNGADPYGRRRLN
jgi:hypothetical protein